MGEDGAEEPEFKAAAIMYRQGGSACIGDVGTVGRATTRITVPSPQAPCRPGAPPVNCGGGRDVGRTVALPGGRWAGAAR